MSNSQRFVLLGHPVSHSLSPVIHQAVYDTYSLPHQYELVDCPDVSVLAEQVGALRAGRLAGANVTVPWKRAALELADIAHPSAQATGAANVLLRDESGRIVAHNTDAPALARVLEPRVQSSQQRGVLILGNGGAALAAVVAAKSLGLDPLYVSARRWAREPLEDERSEEFRHLGARPIAWGQPAFAQVAPRLAAVVQATSAGMSGVGGGEQLASLVPWSDLPPDAFCYDVVYNPPLTPFLEQAMSAHLPAEGGLSMLVGQAAQAIRLWLRVEPPLDAMMQRAQVAIARSSAVVEASSKRSARESGA